ncbi:MAG: UV DNA damage repair endonuclease UvsE [Spirochaetes bacterium]|nr:UV DNA damage repair endonuclease UvsE [Spirochaetota bacterium]
MFKNRIGYACIPLRVDFRTNRKVLLQNYNEDLLLNLIELNLKDLLNILKYNFVNKIYLFRISSEIIPFGSLSSNNQVLSNYEKEFSKKFIKVDYRKYFNELLKTIGDFIKENNLRVSMHPGQYLVLNSEDENVIKNSIDDLIYHCSFLDSLGIDYSHKVIIHTGGKFNNKKFSIQKFIKVFNKLDKDLKKRIILENDEKSFNFDDIFFIYEYTGVPLVFDYFHNLLNPSNRSYSEIFNLVKKTWKKEDGIPKIHYSDKSSYKKFGAHSEFIILKNFLKFYKLIDEYNFDIMLETKDKDISAIKVINSLIYNYLNKLNVNENYENIYSNEKSNDFNNADSKKIIKKMLTDEWSRYKYLVMLFSYSKYKEISYLVNHNNNINEFYFKIDEILSEKKFENIKSTYEHLIGYFKEVLNKKEKEKLLTFLNQNKIIPYGLNYVYNLSKKYNLKFIKEQYLFFYYKYF